MVKPDHTAPYRLLITFVNSLDPLMVFLKEFFENIDFEKNQQMTKKHAKLPSRQKVNLVLANSRSPNGAVQSGSRHIGFKNKIADTEQTSS